jgi:hypothetical protein
MYRIGTHISNGFGKKTRHPSERLVAEPVFQQGVPSPNQPSTSLRSVLEAPLSSKKTETIYDGKVSIHPHGV